MGRSVARRIERCGSLALLVARGGGAALLGSPVCRHALGVVSSQQDWVCLDSLPPTLLVCRPGSLSLSAKRSVTLDALRPLRSEERRVGKECRSRWSPDE